MSLPGPGDGIPLKICLLVLKIMGAFPVVQGVAGNDFFEGMIRAGANPAKDGLACNSGVGLMKRKMMDTQSMFAMIPRTFCGVIDATKDIIGIGVLLVHNAISFSK